jgi:ABC-2 type transport system ATP-binding protein
MKKNNIHTPALVTHKYYNADLQEYKEMEVKPILFIRNLSKRYLFKKKPAIENINFNVYPGEFHAFIGANGAGKTTTIKSIIGAYAN